MQGGVGFGHGQARGHAAVARIGADLVAAAAGQVELVDVGDGIELGRPVPELLGDEMDHQPLALHAAAHAQQARAHDDAAMRVEDPGPDHEVGDAAFVLDGDEHHARGGARPLAHQHQPGQSEAVVVLGIEQHIGARDAPLRHQGPQQRHRMGAQ
jgi:hypothetical protein